MTPAVEPPERVLLAILRLNAAALGTPLEPLVTDVIDALAVELREDAAQHEDAERDQFEARSALLDSPDIISGAHPVSYNAPEAPRCTCWPDEPNAMCPLHGMDAEP